MISDLCEHGHSHYNWTPTLYFIAYITYLVQAEIHFVAHHHAGIPLWYLTLPHMLIQYGVVLVEKKNPILRAIAKYLYPIQSTRTAEWC